MKRNRFVLLSLLSLLLISCNDELSDSHSFENTDSSNISIEENSSSTNENFEFVTLEKYKNYILIDLSNYVRSMNFDSLDEVILNKINTHIENCKNEITLASDYTKVKEAYENVKEKIANEIPLANGIFSIETNLQAISQLESYAERNSLTGLTFFENGSYEVYSDRVTLGSYTYIPGYGFGLLEEGNINEDIDFQPNSAWKRYLHISEDKENLDISSAVRGHDNKYFNYITSSYYQNFLNDNKNSVQTYNVLAKSDLIPVDLDENNEATIFKMEVKTGEDGLKYTTNSTLESRIQFNNRPVELEDYVTIYKAHLNYKNDLHHLILLNEFASYTFSRIKGAWDYYKASKEGPADFNNVGIKAFKENGKNYLQFEMTAPIHKDMIKYLLNKNAYQPVPQDFLDVIGAENYFKSDLNNGIKLMDNCLSLGAYSIEQCCDETKLVLKKNPNYVYTDEKYNIKGIHIDYSNYTSTILERFDSKYIDYVPLTSKEIDKYENNKNFVIVGGDSTFSLNVNSLDEETWEYLFGENGAVCKTPKSEYWNVEPALSNDHFLKALSLSINRKEFAKMNESTPLCSYLSSSRYNGINYNNTKEHQNAIFSKIDNTDGFGYNLDLAREYFKVALLELENENKYVRGTKDNPTIINLEIAWMYPNHEKKYHTYIKDYFETAVNHESVSGNTYKLNIDFWIGNSWSDVYYYKFYNGQYDLGFGKISGSTVPHNIHPFETLSSNPLLSGSFTLNWSLNTNDVKKDYVLYDGKRWSYDALLSSLDTTSFVEKSYLIDPVSFNIESQIINEDGTYTSTLNVDFIDGFNVNIKDVVICWYSGPYKEKSVFDIAKISKNETNNSYTIVINSTKDDVNEYSYDMGFDVYYEINDNDLIYADFASVYGYFEPNIQ